MDVLSPDAKIGLSALSVRFCGDYRWTADVFGREKLSTRATLTSSVIVLRSHQIFGWRVSNQLSGTNHPATVPKAATAECSSNAGQFCSGQPLKHRMKNINWKGILITAGIALGVVLLYPKLRPYAQKLPVVGAWL